MPINYKLHYVGWWKQFSEYIRFERAENRCECEGECGYNHDGRCKAENGNYKLKGQNYYEKGQNGKFYDFAIWSRVCLTVAHLDFDGGICQCKKLTGIKCAIPSHCKAMCNGCHLMMDLPHHIENRRKNIANKKDSERGLFQEFSEKSTA
jgi:hypothetical protein